MGFRGFFLGRKRAVAVWIFLLVFASVRPGQAQSFAGVLTEHNDNARSGENLSETVLTPANVNSSTFGKLFSYSVDGQIYAQPLYVPNVSIPGQGTHNVVYVATQNDSVYAFDADGLSSAPLWQDSFINPGQGITPVACQIDGKQVTSCGVYPIYGVTGTPVIDPSTSTMYLISRTTESGASIQRLHALDITSGAEKFGGPVVIKASVPGTGAGRRGGSIPFNPLHDIQRAGLLLLNGTVYIGWAGAQHGWIMGYDATSLAQVAVFVSRDQGGCAEKLQVPTIANGKVYVSTQNELDVFGLLGSGSAPAVYLSTPCHTFPARALNTTSPPVKITLTNSGTATLQITGIALTGTNPDQFAETNKCKSTLGAGKSCMIAVTFTPTAAGAETGYVMITDSAAGSPHNVFLLGSGKAQ